MKKLRLDELVLARGLAKALAEARALIMAGKVLVNDARADKAGEKFDAESTIRLDSGERYVSRGGAKLEAALKHFELDPTGLIALDIGSSTGGFTDCLIQFGAKKVYAIDVGENQLDWRLRSDERVVALERINARELGRSSQTTFDPKPSLIVMDVSFISARALIEPALSVSAEGALILILVKPQFELPREDISEGGVVRDQVLHQKACDLVAEKARDLKLRVSPPFASPVQGKKARNQEFFLLLTASKAS